MRGGGPMALFVMVARFGGVETARSAIENHLLALVAALYGRRYVSNVAYSGGHMARHCRCCAARTA